MESLPGSAVRRLAYAALLVLLCCPPALSAGAPAPGAFLGVIGTPGTGDGELDYPLNCALDPSGNLFVNDYGNDRVMGFAPDGSFLVTFGSFGCDPGQFTVIRGIAVDREGKVFVADGAQGTISIWDRGGLLLGYLGGEEVSWGGLSGISFAPDGNLYAADCARNTVRVIDPAGNQVMELGVPWSENGQGPYPGVFGYPNCVAVDREGRIFVTDNWSRVQVFSRQGNFLFSWGSYGTGPGQFKYPDGIAIDPAGRVFVADTENHRIQVFDSHGAFLFEWGSEGGGPGQLWYPTGVTLSPDGSRVYVADMWNHRVQVFAGFPSCASSLEFLPPVSLGKDFMRGRTIPVKFALTCPGGEPAPGPCPVLSLRRDGRDFTPSSRAGANRDGACRPTGEKGRYIFNLDTGGMDPGDWELAVTLGDGSAFTTPIHLSR
jgi:DNA-binding beta-propeller fold protein YncE